MRARQVTNKQTPATASAASAAAQPRSATQRQQSQTRGATQQQPPIISKTTPAPPAQIPTISPKSATIVQGSLPTIPEAGRIPDSDLQPLSIADNEEVKFAKTLPVTRKINVTSDLIRSFIPQPSPRPARPPTPSQVELALILSVPPDPVLEPLPLEIHFETLKSVIQAFSSAEPILERAKFQERVFAPSAQERAKTASVSIRMRNSPLPTFRSSRPAELYQGKAEESDEEKEDEDEELVAPIIRKEDLRRIKVAELRKLAKRISDVFGLFQRESTFEKMNRDQLIKFLEPYSH